MSSRRIASIRELPFRTKIARKERMWLPRLKQVTFPICCAFVDAVHAVVERSVSNGALVSRVLVTAKICSNKPHVNQVLTTFWDDEAAEEIIMGS